MSHICSGCVVSSYVLLFFLYSDVMYFPFIHQSFYK